MSTFDRLIGELQGDLAAHLDDFDPQTGEFRAAPHITEIFHGDLVGCNRLWGDYYGCSFT